jgi:SPX domain protein involved in polyphosphate accumulation
LPIRDLLVLLGDGYSLLKECGELRLAGADASAVASAKSQQWVPPSAFERTTTKYWVRQDDLIGICMDIIKELPILVFGKSGRICDEVRAARVRFAVVRRCMLT